MPDEPGPPVDLSQSMYGLAPHPDHAQQPRAKWHLWGTRPATTPEPEIGGVKSYCGGYDLPNKPIDLPKYIPLREGETPRVPEGVVICGKCQFNWMRMGRSGRAYAKKKRDETLADSLSMLTVGLTSVRKTGSNPATWYLVFISETYVVDTDKIDDFELFSKWWFERFHSPMTLDRETWTEFLEIVGKKAEDSDVEGVTDEILIREFVTQHLAHYRIVEDRTELGSVGPHAAFKAEGHIWVPARDIRKALKDEGEKVDVRRLHLTLRGIVTGRSKEFNIRGSGTTCWPVDASLLSRPIIIEEGNGGALKKGQEVLDAHDT
jgi:hypothetical protein